MSLGLHLGILHPEDKQQLWFHLEMLLYIRYEPHMRKQDLGMCASLQESTSLILSKLRLQLQASNFVSLRQLPKPLPLCQPHEPDDPVLGEQPDPARCAVLPKLRYSE